MTVTSLFTGRGKKGLGSMLCTWFEADLQEQNPCEPNLTPFLGDKQTEAFLDVLNSLPFFPTASGAHRTQLGALPGA